MLMRKTKYMYVYRYFEIKALRHLRNCSALNCWVFRQICGNFQASAVSHLPSRTKMLAITRPAQENRMSAHAF